MLSLAGHHGGLNREQFTPHLCPGKAGHLSDPVPLLGSPETMSLYPEVLTEIPRRYLHTGSRGIQQQLFRHLSADFCDFTIQSTNTRFAGVVANDVGQSLAIDTDLALFQTIVALLLVHQVPGCDSNFLILGISRDANNFHPIQ